MKSLRRQVIDNATYFVTVITYNREPLLVNNIDLFWKSWKNQILDAWVILPDHFHAILRPQSSSISDVMHRFKISYSRHIRDHVRSGCVWQNRFWEHVIRDQEDLNNHLDYIHFNPVNHETVDDPFDYSHSSLGSYLEKGLYIRNWRVLDSFEGSSFGE